MNAAFTRDSYESLDSGAFKRAVRAACGECGVHAPRTARGHFAMTMTRITQLENRGAAVAWSPIGTHADFIALGAKVCA